MVTDVDDPPTLDAIADPAAINEDAALQTVNLAGISAGAGETPVLVVTASSSNPALIPNPDGDLHVAERDRVAQLHAGGEHLGQRGDHGDGLRRRRRATQRTFTVVVNEVNDAPTFTPGANQTVTEDAAAQTVASFLGTVSPGPNEASQAITVAISNVTSPSLFAVAPAIGPTGVLTYTPAAEQFGVSTVTYTVSDNGGTANGGVDSVGPQSFTITITAVNDPPTLDGDPRPGRDSRGRRAADRQPGGHLDRLGGESAQPLQVTAVSGNTGVIPNPTVTYVAPSATGSLSLHAGRQCVRLGGDHRDGHRRRPRQRPRHRRRQRHRRADLHGERDRRQRRAVVHQGRGSDGGRGCRRPDRRRLGDGHLRRPERGGPGGRRSASPATPTRGCSPLARRSRPPAS